MKLKYLLLNGFFLLITTNILSKTFTVINKTGEQIYINVLVEQFNALRNKSSAMPVFSFKFIEANAQPLQITLPDSRMTCLPGSPVTISQEIFKCRRETELYFNKPVYVVAGHQVGEEPIVGIDGKTRFAPQLEKSDDKLLIRDGAVYIVTLDKNNKVRISQKRQQKSRLKHHSCSCN